MLRQASIDAPSRDPGRAAVRRRGFTLIEVLIVIVIIVTLAAMSVFVGGAVKRQMSSRSTRTTLHTLQNLMEAYLKAGNPEPDLKNADALLPKRLPTDPNPCQSDKVNFVRALRTFAASNGGLGNIPLGDDGSGNKTMLDAFGQPIRFVPSTEPNNTTKRPYFFSAGPDGVPYNNGPGTPSDMTADNITSLDTL